MATTNAPKGTFNAAVVANLKRHYPERFTTSNL
jgi:hypothetical protein